ncbi:hypothetical protein JRQ81_009820 [Phrynocephalus forsythii]|uniref:Small ribosomal subunit protein bS16m n=1 Tax=Phrynocephalus forsythii TaxID=171643 RepID=A0A9Q0XAT1_9SAUR|nr:hypothetical protein JRQ81_009820 [Phrynocephalus forsythii]
MVQLGRPLLKQYHNMRLVIRMSMGGCANRPFFRIVAAYNKRARDGKYLEQLGCYDPLPNDHGEKIVGINFERLKFWIATGATVTKPVEKLLGLAGFFPLHPMTVTNAERFRRRKAREEAARASAAAAEEETPAESEAKA